MAIGLKETVTSNDLWRGGWTGLVVPRGRGKYSQHMVINSHLVDERLQVTTFGAADGRPFFWFFFIFFWMREARGNRTRADVRTGQDLKKETKYGYESQPMEINGHMGE